MTRRKPNSELCTIRTDTSSATVVMWSDDFLFLGLVGLLLVFMGAFEIGMACPAVITPIENWREFNYSWAGILSLIVLGLGYLYCGWLCVTVIDLRSITVAPGRATVAWRLFRTPIRSLTFNVRLVVIHQDLWRNGKGSTDRVVLEGDEQRHTVATVWNMPATGSLKPPFESFVCGPASKRLAQDGISDEQTVSPPIFSLAKALASAASVPIEFRVGETHRPLDHDLR